MKKSLKHQLFEAVNVQPDDFNTKLTEAPAIRQKEKGKFMVPIYGAVVFADLIYMNEDSQGFKFILTVVDVATRKMDAIGLKGRTSQDIIEAFEQIWKRPYLPRENILHIYTDPGTEFKNNDFKEYLNTMGIGLRHTMTARKSQSGVVEYYNHLITKALNTKTTTQELATKQANYEWREYLDKIVKVLNDENNTKKPNIKEYFKDMRTTNTELNNRLEVGTLVHVRLQQPKDHLMEKNNKLHGGFRNGDVRWELDTTTISNVLLLPNQPIRYMVKKYNNVSFMRKELLLANDAQNPPNQIEPIQNAPNQAVEPQIDTIASRTRSKVKPSLALRL
jgi:hypothetical protein